MDQCAIPGAGGLACSQHLRTTVVAFDGVLHRIRFCTDHYDWLQEYTSPVVDVEPADLTPTSAPPHQASEPEIPASTTVAPLPEALIPAAARRRYPDTPERRVRRKAARKETACQLPDGTLVPWPTIRRLLAAWKVDVRSTGRVNNAGLDIFLETVGSKDDLDNELAKLLN